jgi:cation diffusion facilitator CzcD-associated flavoprotein CzcO
MPAGAGNDVLVVGAGPAGLAVSACLIRQGVGLTVIEKADSVASSWQAHYRRLHLHTVSGYSSLPFMPFPVDYPRYVAREQVVRYLESYARQFSIEPQFGQEAIAIQRRGDCWETTCAGGRRYGSRFVVVATGANNQPNMPAFPGQEQYRGRLEHSRGYADARPFANERVLVVGMGNTGAEIALDLAEHGVDVALSVRSSVNVVHRDVLGRPTQLTSMALARLPARIGDALARMLRDLTVGDLSRHGLRTTPTSPLRQLREEGRTPVIDVGTLAMIKKGRITVRPGIEEFTRRGVRFADGRPEAFDAVILATGYRPAVDRLFPGVELRTDANGMPVAVAGSGQLAGVYFIGFDVRQAGGLLRTIGMQAMQVAQQIGRMATDAVSGPATRP